MRNALPGGLLTVLLAAGTAGAQYRDPYGNPYPNDRRGYADQGRHDRGLDPIDRTLSDLDRAESARFVDRGNRRHLDDARKDLIRFVENRSRGRFDRGRLDNAIGHLEHLLRSPQLHPRDREVLARDRDALRDFRTRGGYYGYRDGRRW
jgi:hypothetical protein